MKIISTIVGIVLFVLFFGFALKNSQLVDLRLFLSYELRAPLVLMLLMFFAAGAVLGVLALTPALVRARRETVRQKNLIHTLQTSALQVNRAPDSVNAQQ